MVMVLSLWLPIVVSAVLVFLASAAVHMVLRYHATDYGPVPDEESVAAPLRALNLSPGDYTIPYARGMKEMDTPEFKEKWARGPVATITVRRHGGDMGMGRQLGLWFLYILVVSAFAAYVTGAALAPGASYGEVFRFAGTTALIAYALGSWSESIWFGRRWSTTLKNTLDGIIYALLTAGVFGWLWPSA